MQDLAAPAFDVPEGYSRADVADCIRRGLASKGFCTLASGLDDDAGDAVLRDVKLLSQRGVLRKPPRLVADGLLGEAGSALLAELPSSLPEEPGAGAVGAGGRAGGEVGEALQAADRRLSELGADLMEAGATGVAGRTRALLQQTGPPGLEEADLTEEQASYWLSTLTRGRIMMLMFFGPGHGVLELTLAGDEEIPPYEVVTGPGAMVVLRSDLLLHEHRSEEVCYVLSAFAVGERQQWFKKPGANDLMPAARALDRWLLDRMEVLKRQLGQSEDVSLLPNIPRDFQRVMNRIFLKGERTALRGTSCKVANVDGSDMFHRVALSGFDSIVEVPISRWTYEDSVDPNAPDAYCRHIGVVEDIATFDNKFFLISLHEASTMDPVERKLLELGYETLADAGLTKKRLMNSDCGVFVAATSEVAAIEDRGMFANRLNFCLGCKGPSIACDVDHASALVAVRMCSAELGRACDQGIAVGCQINLSPQTWMVHCLIQGLSRTGRTKSFGAFADGFIRADGLAGVYMRKLCHSVDGEEVWDESLPLLGVLQAAACKSQGRTAGLRHVDGPCLQELLAEAARTAQVSPLDMEAVECDAKAHAMHDAVEVSSVLRAFRPETPGRGEECVTLSAVKAVAGNAHYCAGLVALLRVIAAGLYGVTIPLLHFKQLSPLAHSDAFDRAVIAPSEAVTTQADASFMGVTACGWGGTNAHVVVWGRVDSARISLGTPSPPEKVYFWPGGGRTLARDEEPTKAYTIVGTWSSWRGPQEMQLEGDGVYGYTVTLGANCWELFQIWLDGDSSQVLHPGYPKAPKSTPVQGPSVAGVELSWLIDGRFSFEAAASTEPEADYDPGGGWADQGWPGALFRVRLRVAGQWRLVDWERLSNAADWPVGGLSAGVLGRYFVAGTWNCWSFEEMREEEEAQGVYSLEVVLYSALGVDFQVVRNEDWQQILYPYDNEVAGPDDGGHGSSWHIDGCVGDVFRIELQRCRDEAGADLKAVTWQRVRSLRRQDLNEARVALALRPRFFVAGNWDGWRSRRELTRDAHVPGALATSVDVPTGVASFQILLDGCWGAILHPGIADAGPEGSHIFGPTACAAGLHWTISVGPQSWAPAGGGLGAEEPPPLPPRRRYEVRLLVNPEGWPLSVSWAGE